MWGEGRVDTVCLGDGDVGGALQVRNWVQGMQGSW